MINFKNFLIEASYVKDELEKLKDDNSEFGLKLKSWLFGSESPFTSSGSKRFKTLISKEVPKEIKLTYPDVVFALQALYLHVGGESYYDRWEEAKKFLKFAPKYKKMTLHRFWNISENDLEDLQNGKSIQIKTQKFTSYTRNSSLFKDVKIGKTEIQTFAINTTPIIASDGNVLTLLTKHELTPVFDIFYFIVHLLNSVKKVFDENIDSIKGIPTTFLNEREVIAHGVTSISPKDVVGYYKNAQFAKLEEETLDLFGKKITASTISIFKNDLLQHGMIDRSMFGNTILVTSNPEKSGLKMYAKKFEKHEPISEAVGFDVWVSKWK